MHLPLPPPLLQEARPAWNPLGLRRSSTTRSTRPYAQVGLVLPRVQAVAALSPGGCPSCNVLPQLPASDSSPPRFGAFIPWALL